MLKVYYPISPFNTDFSIVKDNLKDGIEIITGEDIPKPADYDVLICGRPTKEQIDASSKLKYLIIPWAGVTDEVKDLLVQYPQISVHNLHHNAIPTAEMALMLLLAAAKQSTPIDKVFRKNDWTPRYEPNPAIQLSGKTVLILGYGNIGQHVAKVCLALGMRVKIIRKNANKDVPKNLDVDIYETKALHQVLPEANVLICTLPLTTETEGLIGEREIALMKDKAIIINVGRGKVIDQKAFYNALKSGKLHSAGIDVWYNYPKDEASRKQTPPADYPFNEFPNVIMSPHRGGGSEEIEVLRMSALSKLINCIHDGDVIPNKVNLKEGY